MLADVTPDVLRVVAQRPNAHSFLVATSASCETHAADARFAARLAGAGAAAAARDAVDAKLRAETSLRIAVNSICEQQLTSSGGRDTRDKRSGVDDEKVANVSRNTFGAEDVWGDWGSGSEDDTRSTSLDCDTNGDDATQPGTASQSRQPRPGYLVTKNRLALKYFPAPFVPLSQNAFLLPAGSATATARLSKVRAGGMKADDYDASVSTVTEQTTALRKALPSFEDGTEEDGGDFPAPGGVAIIAETLLAIGESIGCAKFECFALGRCARAVAHAVCIGSPPSESSETTSDDGTGSDSWKKRNNRTCALVVVDRVCDLLTPSVGGYHSSGFLAKAMSVGQRRSCVDDDGHHTSFPFTSSDFCVASTSPFVGEHYHKSVRATKLPTGVLAHPNDAAARVWVTNAFGKILREAATSVRRWLLDTLRDEGLPVRSNNEQGKGNQGTGDEIGALCVPIVNDPKMRMKHGGLLQCSVVVREALLADETAETAGGTSSQKIVQSALRDASAAIAVHAGEGAAAAAVAFRLRASLKTGSSPGVEKAETNRALSPKQALELTFALFVIAGELSCVERRALDLPPIDFSSLNDELDPDDLDSEREIREINDAQKSPFSMSDESLIKDALVAVISNSGTKESDVENRPADDVPYVNDVLGVDLRCTTTDRAFLENAVDAFLKKLGVVAQARRRYTSAGSLLQIDEGLISLGNSGDTSQITTGVLKELAERVCVGADGKSDGGESQNIADDLKHVASSLGGLLKSFGGETLGRLGLLKGVSKALSVEAPKPSDSEVVLFFVLGGVTADEIYEVRKAAASLLRGGNDGFETSEKKVCEILIGSTGLLGDGDVLRMVTG